MNKALKIFVASKDQLDEYREEVNDILDLPQTYAYYLEITIRGESNFLSKSELGLLLFPTGLSDSPIFFSDESTSDFDNRVILFTVPALTANNGTWFNRHPWILFNLPNTSLALSTFHTILENYDPKTQAGFGFTAIYPFKTSSFPEDSLLSVPRSGQHFYHVTLGRNELLNSASNLEFLAQGNRYIWNNMTSVSNTTFYPSFYLPDVNPSDWEKHFGANWPTVQALKLQLDPEFVFADQRNFGFAELYNN